MNTTPKSPGEKPKASISLDLDNQWSYMKIHGDEGWQDYPSYLDIFVPHVLKALRRWDLKITFFIVGQDAALQKNHAALRMITADGHEVGNHSFHHESWLQTYSRDQIESEIETAENALIDATGQRPIGFRGPGFSWSRNLLETLERRGYLFDTSTLPTYLGPLARMYYFWTADLSADEKKKRKELFGTFSDGRRSVRPYLWQLEGDRQLLEIPVTTIPVIKSPFHLSYLIYLSRFSPLLMTAYLQIALLMCRMTGVTPCFLLHPLDLIGADQVEALAFFPGMDLSSRHKLGVFHRVIGMLGRHFELVNMSTHSRELLATSSLNAIPVHK
jgi:peptidoglycan-N-acetylglucosamine deacetylase